MGTLQNTLLQKVEPSSKKIEWICFPHLIAGAYCGPCYTSGTSINGTPFLQTYTLKAISFVRKFVYEFESNVRIANDIPNHISFQHRFSFPDEMGFMLALQHKSQINVKYPHETDYDIISTVRDYVRSKIRERSLFKHPDTERLDGKAKTLVWDVDQIEEQNQARMMYDDLKQQGFHAVPFDPSTGDITLRKSSKIIKFAHPPERRLDEEFESYLDFLHFKK